MDELDIRLIPQTSSGRCQFAEEQVLEVARQHVMAGEWPAADAERLARENLADLLAGRLDNVGHLFLDAHEHDARVGRLWVAPRPAFLADTAGDVRWLAQITVLPPHRRRGVGRAMLDALHARLAAEGVDELWLRVYDWNADARRLYERAGYTLERQFATDAHFRRRLRDE